MVYLNLFRKAPWWLYAVFALCFFASAEGYFHFATKLNAERAEALSQPAPAPIDLTDFDWKTDRSLANEVTVTGWIDWDNSIMLVDFKKSGEIKSERAAYFLYGAGDTPEAGQVRAIMLLSPEHDAFFMANENKFLVNRPVNPNAAWTYQINGLAKRTSKLDNLAMDALEDRELTAADGVFFIEPFIDGRAAGLAPLENLSFGRFFLHSIGGLILTVSIIKFILRRRRAPMPKKEFELDPAKFSAQLDISEGPAEVAFKKPPEPPLRDRFAAALNERLGILKDRKTVLNAAGTILLLSMVFVPSWIMLTVPLGLVLWLYANNETFRTRVDTIWHSLSGREKSERETARLRPQTVNPFR